MCIHRCLVSLVIINLVSNVVGSAFDNLKHQHAVKQFNDAEVVHIAQNYDEKEFKRILDAICIPRTVGSTGWQKVIQFIKNEMKQLKWHVAEDKFVDRTPKGQMTFTNIIATLNPEAERFLVISCHFDSKLFHNEVFLGATDSAVPCSMMISLAKSFKNEFAQLESDVSLKFIFFDGEEAFKTWGPKDSLYGSRHLAATMHGKRSLSRSTEEHVSDLQRIDVFVLLDLLGAAHPRFYNYIDLSEGWYTQISDCELRLTSLNLLKKSPEETFFIRRNIHAFIEDDHVPFFKRGVRVLHIIPTPFPDVWHTSDDNKENLDMSAISDFNSILRLFVAQYMNVSVPQIITPGFSQRPLFWQL